MIQTDVAVVGAGVIGCAVALELAEHRKVTLVDSLEERSASGAAGAMLGALGEVSAADSAQERTARLRAHDLYESWLAALGRRSDPPRLRRGTIVVASSADPNDRSNLKAIARAASEVGRPTERVDPDHVDARPAADRPLVAALRLPEEGWLDASALLRSLRQSTERHEGITLLRARAAALLGDRRGVTGVVTRSGDRVEARQVVACAGASTTQLLGAIAAAGVLPPIFEAKGTALVLDAGRELAEVMRTPNRAYACGIHLVPRPGNRVYVGATNRVTTRAGATGSATAGEVHLLLDTALQQLDTRLERADVVEVLHGSRPLSADRLPLVGVTELSGLAVATGTYRNGVLLAPLVAELVRREIDAAAPVDDNPFGCVGRTDLLRARLRGVEATLRSGARQLSTLLLEPGGRLPYDRAEMLDRLLSAVLPQLLRSDSGGGDLSRDLLGALPLEEIVPELAILLARAEHESTGAKDET